MVTTEIRTGTSVPVELIRWARDGKVQVLRRRVIDGHAVLGMFFAVPAMKLVDSGGRGALARALARLPQAEAGR